MSLYDIIIRWLVLLNWHTLTSARRAAAKFLQNLSF